MAAGAVSLKKPHHIITLRFSEVVKDHDMVPNRPCALLKKNNNNALSLVIKMGNE